MPSQLALALWASFVMSLLRPERRPSDGVSAAPWIPCLWMLAIAALEAGKSVFVEKPLAILEDDLARVLNAAR